MAQEEREQERDTNVPNQVLENNKNGLKKEYMLLHSAFAKLEHQVPPVMEVFACV